MMNRTKSSENKHNHMKADRCEKLRRKQREGESDEMRGKRGPNMMVDTLDDSLKDGRGSRSSRGSASSSSSSSSDESSTEEINTKGSNSSSQSSHLASDFWKVVKK